MKFLLGVSPSKKWVTARDIEQKSSPSAWIEPTPSEFDRPLLYRLSYEAIICVINVRGTTFNVVFNSPGLLVAPMINTCFLASSPSISVSSWFTTRTLTLDLRERKMTTLREATHRYWQRIQWNSLKRAVFSRVMQSSLGPVSRNVSPLRDNTNNRRPGRNIRFY